MATNEQLLKQNLIFNEFVNNADFTASFDGYTNSDTYGTRAMEMGTYTPSVTRTSSLSMSTGNCIIHLKLLSNTSCSSDSYAVAVTDGVNKHGLEILGATSNSSTFYGVANSKLSGIGIANYSTFRTSISSLSNTSNITLFFKNDASLTGSKSVIAYLNGTKITSGFGAIDATTWTDFVPTSITFGDSGGYYGYLYDVSVFDIGLLDDLSEATIAALLYNNTLYYGQYKFCYELSSKNVIKRRKTRDEVINESLRICGRMRAGDTPFSDDVDIAINSLDAALTDLSFYGFRSWQIEEVSRDLFASDVIDVNGTAYTCKKGHVASQVNKPGSGALWKKYWTAEGTTTGDWKHGTTYRTIHELKLDGDTIDIMKVYLTDTNGNDEKITVIGMDEYYAIEDKREGGTPSYAYIDFSYEEPVLYLDYATSAVYDTINYLRIKGVNGLLEATDNVEIDPQWRKIIVYKLATYLADEFDLPLQKRQYINMQFERLVQLGRKGDSRGIPARVTEGAY